MEFQIFSYGGSGVKFLTNFLLDHIDFECIGFTPVNPHMLPDKTCLKYDKILYIYVDPRDAVLSFFRRSETDDKWWMNRHLFNLGIRKMLPKDIEFDEYIRRGDVFKLRKHFTKWLAFKHPNIAFVKYEDLFNNTRQILTFLGIDQKYCNDLKSLICKRNSDYRIYSEETQAVLYETYGELIELQNTFPGFWCDEDFEITQKFNAQNSGRTVKIKKHLSWWHTNMPTQKGDEDFQRWCGDFNKPFKQEIRKHIAKKNYSSVLDCGAGLCTEYYGFKHDKYDIKYQAIDITPQFVEMGQKNGIDIRLGTLEDLPFKDNSVDVSICLDTLNHQLDFKKSIDEMLRVSSKEVIITFFKDFSEKGEIEERRFDSLNRCNLIYNHFNKSDLLQYLDNKGVTYRFEMVEGNVILHITLDEFLK